MNPVRPLWYYTYVLISKTYGKFYTGATAELKKGVTEHNNGLVTSTKYKRPLQLIYFEACLSKDDAYRRERYLKSGMGKRYLRNRLKGGLTG